MKCACIFICKNMETRLEEHLSLREDWRCERQERWLRQALTAVL